MFKKISMSRLVFYFLCSTFLLFTSFTVRASAKDVKVVITNTGDDQRHEVVEVDMASLKRILGPATNLVVKNRIGQQIISQQSYDGKLLIDASVRPHSSSTYYISVGKPLPMKSFVYGRMVPERKDDIAWENDRCAYRVYGPALQRSGERSFGIDVWVKNTPELVINQRYATDIQGFKETQHLRKEGQTEKADSNHLATSFHIDRGTGYDPYAVGPTLGCGAPALLIGDSIVMPYCYENYQILDQGPLRFTVALRYEPKEIHGNKSVVEHRIISLDKGRNFNKMTVWYTGLKRPTDFAAGFVIHADDTTTVRWGKNYIQYADPTDNIDVNNSQLYIGILFPVGFNQTRQLNDGKPSGGNLGHALAIHHGLKDSERITYYFGAAWSRYDVLTQREWQLRIDETLDWLTTPLKVEMQSNR
ncbi:DUF4861 family protein [Hallella bergensis]|uniref:DUF4861 family protein n=1 Tax=Hallella bergensis TaxID=242750 RepID=UPI0039904A9D